jgi:hypothetical protein
MKLSIFKTVNPLPKSKDEKHQQSKKASQCEVVEIANDDQLVQSITTYAWSPFIFKNNKRLADNFISCDLLVYDIDEGLTIDACEAIITKEKLCCLCLPSPSHTPENQRFRVVLPLARTITSPQVYEDTWFEGAKLFGVVDEQCKDRARFFFSCTTDDGFWLEGDFFNPIVKAPADVVNYTPSQTYMIEVTEDIDKLVQDIYGEKRNKIPEAVDFFLKNAHTGLKGKWVNSLNAAVFSLALSGVDEEKIFDVIEQLAPQALDKKDKYQIKRAIRDGKSAT